MNTQFSSRAPFDVIWSVNFSTCLATSAVFNEYLDDQGNKFADRDIETNQNKNKQMADASKKNYVSNSNFAPPIMKDFVLTEKLGEGSYAVVYKGYKKGNTRDIVAVKCIKKSTLGKSSSENLFREIEILKSLDHEHIVKLKDFQWDENNIFLILEYCSGGDLSTFIRRYRHLPEHVARKFLRQLALALQFIREKNISHMDLKPHNLLLDSKENPILKVGDFGFAQHILDKEGRHNLRGSPLYMAVEMFLSDTYNASVDLWSCGVILFETLFGYAPFASKTYEELELKILSNDKVAIPNSVPLSPNCRDLLTRLLQRDPIKRISFEEFFSHPFVDLEHAPRKEALQKAISTVTEAIQFDEKRDFKNSIEKYCSALEYFIPAIDFERDPKKKAAIRGKVDQYVLRAEQLKTYQKQSAKKTLTRQSSIDSLCDHLPGITQALKHVEQGEKFDDECKYEDALQEYYKAIEICLSICKTLEKSSEPYRVVSEKARGMMKRAEELTLYRDTLERKHQSPSYCSIQ